MSTEVVEILRRLIGFQTISALSNLQLIEWIRLYLRDHGVPSRLTFNAARDKANLFATIGTHAQGGIVLSGHTDVVPVQGQRWTTDPFIASLRDDKIFGRGSCDMKGFIAVVLGLVPQIVAARRPEAVHLAFSFDEEVGCLGVRELLADPHVLAARPRGCIIGEPTGMNLVVAHKGAGMYACQITGVEAHSSLAPRGVNAIHFAGQIIVYLDAIATRLFHTERRDAGFDIPYSTIQVNQIAGGTAGNIVAGGCRFTFDIRHLAWTSRDVLLTEIRSHIDRVILPAMRAVAPQCDVEIRQLADIPAFAIGEHEPFVAEVRPNVKPPAACGCVAFGTEAGLYQASGIATVVCGPGSIDQAHRPDEFVAVQQLEDCARMLRGVVLAPVGSQLEGVDPL